MPKPDIHEEHLQLKAICNLGLALAAHHQDFDDKLNSCVGELSEVIKAEQVSLMILEDGVLVVRAASNKKIVGMAVPMDQDAISTSVVRTGQPVYTKEVTEETRLAGLCHQGDASKYRTGSLMCLPLLDDTGPVGVLNFTDKIGAPYFSEYDFTLAQGIAVQLGRLIHFSALHAKLDEAYSRLEATQQAKDELMHMIFHDMKAPITAVKEVLNLLSEPGGLTEELRGQYLGLAQGDLELLWRRITNMLDLNRLDADQYPMNPANLNLCTLVEETVRRLKPIARAYGVELTLDCQGEPEPLADEDLVERMVTNLITNAMRYSAVEQGGGGKVQVSVLAEEGKALIQVCDSGPGVDPALGEGIFERFKQGKNSPGSSGLGLFFCRRASSMMGGGVDYDNLDGGGAKFTLSLPL